MVQMGIIFLFLIPFEWYKIKQICLDTNLCLYGRKKIISGNDDKAAFGLLVAAAVAMFEVISKALGGFFNTLVASVLPALADIFPNFLKKQPNPSACIVLSLTITDSFSITNRKLSN